MDSVHYTNREDLICDFFDVVAQYMGLFFQLHLYLFPHYPTDCSSRAVGQGQKRILELTKKGRVEFPGGLVARSAVFTLPAWSSIPLVRKLSYKLYGQNF